MSSKKFIDGGKHTNAIMYGMESSSDGAIPIKARKNLIQPLLRRTPRTLLEIERSPDSTKLLSASEIFIESDKHVRDPFKERKQELAVIGQLEVSTRRFPNILNIGSFTSENIFDGVEAEEMPQSSEIQSLKEEIYSNIKNSPVFQE
jgi:hypothetical protein